jgi:hypothetical protein
VLRLQLRCLSVHFIPVTAVPQDSPAHCLESVSRLRIFNQHSLRLELGLGFHHRHHLIHVGSSFLPRRFAMGWFAHHSYGQLTPMPSPASTTHRQYCYSHRFSAQCLCRRASAPGWLWPVQQLSPTNLGSVAHLIVIEKGGGDAYLVPLHTAGTTSPSHS